MYAAPAQTVAVLHQISAAGELYAVSTKAVNRKNKEEPLKEKPVKEQPPQGDNDDSEKIEGVSGNTYVAIAYIAVHQNFNYVCMYVHHTNSTHSLW